MQTYGLLVPGILLENNGISNTILQVTDLLKLKTDSEGMTFHHFIWSPQSPDLNLIENE